MFRSLSTVRFWRPLARQASAVDAEWTLDRDGLEWKLPEAGRYVAAALLAGHNEGFAV